MTGGGGFLGSFVVENLRKKGCTEIFVPRSKDYDLVKMSDVLRLFDDARPNIVIHLAARVGGIHANRVNPAKYFYDNLMMGAQLLEVGCRVGVEKLVAIGTICAYPKFCHIPFKEEDIWNGYPEETNAPYGLAKKMLLVQAQAYRKQYGFNAVVLFPVNLYGPHDNFDLLTSHVIPGVIRKCLEAKENIQGKSNEDKDSGQTEPVLTVWGTGVPTREFLYVEDAAEGIILAAEHYNSSEPVNLGSGKEISIKELVLKISKLTGFQGEIVWDSSMPDGQLRRCLDVTKAKELFGFEARTSLDEGLKKTIEWYKSEVSF